MELDVKTSRKIAKIVNAEDKNCFYNSVLGVMALEEPDAVYVEGYCVDERFGIIMDHGWIESGDRIIDPTPTYHNSADKKHYFPARRYTREDIRKRLRKRGKTTLPFIGHIALREDDFRAAYEQAERFTYGDKYEEITKWRSQLNFPVPKEG